ncbi:MAG: MtrB/PioB family decaheme-associated outer membrane protein [Proteobacteria bacterium]|nr:MtrB/PioB family decaheme-associated outer membrane protein [Pseudomonadota bacterium]
MRNNNGKMQVSLVALAVQGALLAMCAMPVHAEDDEVAALKNPTNTVEIGATNVSRASAKFGEYNGMNKAGVDVDLGISLKGGDSYGESNGIRRWSINGSDLGLTSRAAGATVGDQGKWNIGVGYDELQHNLWDTYKTPYIGGAGGNTFTLPASMTVAAPANNATAGLSNTTAAGTGPTGTDRAVWLAAFNAAAHPMDIGTSRKNTSVNAGYVINEQWAVKFDYNHLDQSGAKLASFGSMANLSASPTITNETMAMLANPTNYKTDTINLALNWLGDKAHVSTSYFGSFFKEGYDRVNFQTFAGPVTTGISGIQTMSTFPSNDFHQLNVSGGYDFSSKTKLTGGLSYARNTQNDAFVADAFSMVAAAPAASLNGLVNTYHADLKLTDQTTKDLKLSGSIKYDERDDKTASNIYRFNALDTSLAHIANFANTPFSNKKTQLEMAGDYRLDKDQHLRFAYNREEIKRWCDQYAIGGVGSYAAAPYLTAAAGINSYPAGVSCVVATGSHDDKLSAAYKLKANDALDMNFAYTYSDRVTTSDPNAITARLGLSGNPSVAATAAATNIQGLNAGDFRGFYPFFDASRKQQMVKVGANWQANEKWTLAAGMKLTEDKYPSTYGVTKGSSWGVNLDANYAYSENGSIVGYLTQQHRQRDMTDLYRSPTTLQSNATATALLIPSGATWSDAEANDDMTVGIGAKRNNLMDAKLDIATDLTYTLGRTNYNTYFNYAAATTGTGGLPVYTCASPQFLTCGSMPTVQSKVIQLKLTGKYKVDKQSRVMLGYIYQQMKSSDYYFNGLQAGFTPTSMMPSNLQAPNYTVNVITVAYIHDF